jgi:hypothetical protein
MVQVIQDPGGAATVIDYPAIIDADDPLLTGTVGLANWGSATTGGNGAVWSSYGGVPGPLVVVIPEPAAGLAVAGALGLLRRVRRPRTS